DLLQLEERDGVVVDYADHTVHHIARISGRLSLPLVSHLGGLSFLGGLGDVRRGLHDGGRPLLPPERNPPPDPAARSPPAPPDAEQRAQQPARVSPPTTPRDPRGPRQPP